MNSRLFDRELVFKEKRLCNYGTGTARSEQAGQGSNKVDVNRSRRRSPNLCASDRILAGLLAFLVRPTRLRRSAIVLKPSTLLGVGGEFRKLREFLKF